MPAAKRRSETSDPDRDLASLSPNEARETLAAGTSADVKTGVLEIFGDRIMLVHPAVLVNIQKQLEQTVGASTKGMMYLAGERNGKDGLNILGHLAPAPGSDGPDPSYLVRLGDVAALAGWGRFEVGAVDLENAHFTIYLEHSPIASFYGPSKKPVCYFLAGWLAGIAGALFGLDLLCEETACMAQGRPRCEFQMRTMPSL